MKWTTLEYEPSHRGADWYWALGLMALLGAGVAIYFNNVLFAILIVLSAIILISFAVRTPKEIDVEISKKGVRIQTVLYPFSSLEGFWVDEDIHPPRLILKSKKFFSPLIVLMIEDVEVVKLEMLLENHIEMIELEEPFISRIMDHLGF